MSEHSSNSEVQMGSDRSFGLVFAAAFALIALYPLLRTGGIRWWSMATAVGFLAAALVAPALLHPLNRVWFMFGLMLNKIVSPVVMGLVFFIVVTPIGLIRRLKDSDPLKQKFDPEAKTYWVSSDRQAGSKSLHKQF